jgi:dTDP-4-dehydrorhamnose 3,5-epimerase
MPYEVMKTSLSEVLLLKPKIFGDARGCFFESFNTLYFEMATGLVRNFVQDNHSCSRRHTLRGLHYQTEHPQGKLVRVVQGEVFDVAVDLRRSSPNFRKWTGTVLSADNKLQQWVPEGFGHGFLVLSESAEFLYKTTDYWCPEYERCILWSDPAIGIHWPLTETPQLSNKDEMAKRLLDADIYA